MGSLVMARVRGTMLWFNEEKDLGALRTDEGERLEIPGAAFGPGEKPIGRCAGRTIEFDWVAGTVSQLAFVQEPDAGRARRRRGR
jgi:hypothetical protein